MTHVGTTAAALSLFLGLAQVPLSSPFTTTVVLPSVSQVRTSGAGCGESVSRSVGGCGSTRTPPRYRGDSFRVPWALDATARVEDEVDVHLETKELKKAAKEKRIAHRVRFDMNVQLQLNSHGGEGPTGRVCTAPPPPRFHCCIAYAIKGAVGLPEVPPLIAVLHVRRIVLLLLYTIFQSWRLLVYLYPMQVFHFSNVLYIGVHVQTARTSTIVLQASLWSV